MKQRIKTLTGMRAVVGLGIGQLVSLVGTGMTRFAMTIWVWQVTEKATAVAFLLFFSVAPSVFLSPMTGALVDRWNRKKVMIVADLVAAATTLALWVLYATDSLQIWHLYAVGVIASVAESFQAPAQMASVTMMVPSEQHARANGIISTAQFGSGVLAPVLAGMLIRPLGIRGILGLDIATFLFAVALLLLLRIPQPPAGEQARERASVWRDTVAGLHYVLARKPMLHVIFVFTLANLLFGAHGGLLHPMILARTAQNARILGVVMTASGVGGVSGGLLLSIWGGPKRRIHGALLGVVGANLLGPVVLGLGQSIYPWAFGAFFAIFFAPILDGCILAIGQAKVPPELQGRVFGLLRMVAQASFPMAVAVMGPLADHVFEPAMRAGGALAPLFGSIVGTGPGAGMGLLMVLCGLIGSLVGAGAYLFPTIRRIETILPDQTPPGEKDGGQAGW